MAAQLGKKPKPNKKGNRQLDDSESEGYQGSDVDDEDGDSDISIDAEGEEDDEADYNHKPTKPKTRAKPSNRQQTQDDHDFVVDSPAPAKSARFVPTRRAKAPKVADSEEDDEVEVEHKPELVEHKTRSGRTTTRPAEYQSDDSQAEERDKKRGKLRRGKDREGEYEDPADEGSTYEDSDGNLKKRTKPRERRSSGDYGSDDHETSDTGTELDLNDEDSAADEMVQEARNNAPRALRTKNAVDYYRPLNIDPVEGSGKKRKKSGSGKGMFGGMPSKMSGEQYAALYPGMAQDSDSVSHLRGSNSASGWRPHTTSNTDVFVLTSRATTTCPTWLVGARAGLV